MKHLWLIVVMALLAGCERGPAGSAAPSAPTVPMLPTVRVELAGKPFTLEVADDPDEMQRGLMFRQSMPRDHGMLFAYENERILSFWMKNTYIPLDIVFLDSAGRVVTIKQMKPLDLTSTAADRPARYAIELNAGVAGEIGLKPGDLVALPDLRK
jgi:uncharacterized membrane protein (UPF0127 family)